MTFGPAFRVPKARSRTVTLIDLFFAAVLTFLVIPVGLFVIGFGLTLLTHWIGFGRPVAEVITGIGMLGLYAWIGIPAGVLLGWIATRLGWIGWAFAPLAGGVGGFVTGAVILLVEGDTLLANEWAFPMILVLPGALFGLMGWCSLRYMRGDLYRGVAS